MPGIRVGLLNFPDGFNISPGPNKGEDATVEDDIDSDKFPPDSDASICN